MISSGQTWKLQSLDINIHKVFKQNLRNKYVKYYIEDNKFKVTKNTIIEWVNDIWYLDSIITNQMILILFQYAGISSELDWSEYNQFRGYQDLEIRSETIKLDNEEALNQNNYYETSSESDQW